MLIRRVELFSRGVLHHKIVCSSLGGSPFPRTVGICHEGLSFSGRIVLSHMITLLKPFAWKSTHFSPQVTTQYQLHRVAVSANILWTHLRLPSHKLPPGYNENAKTEYRHWRQLFSGACIKIIKPAGRNRSLGNMRNYTLCAPVIRLRKSLFYI